MKTIRQSLIALSLSASLAALTTAGATAAGPYAQVLLISVDGMHAIDLASYVAAHPASTLASLSKTAIQYTNALTPAPSDSFPGMLALVTGGAPRSTGVFL
jgi:predicted AlkP superfamily pyrophosphatase or phosphodiesterase